LLGTHSFALMAVCLSLFFSFSFSISPLTALYPNPPNLAIPSLCMHPHPYIPTYFTCLIVPLLPRRGELRQAKSPRRTKKKDIVPRSTSQIHKKAKNRKRRRRRTRKNKKSYIVGIHAMAGCSYFYAGVPGMPS